VVYVARDEELNREVALKEIRERNADHLQYQAKFLLEAEVTGGLEHPGIVPVYGLGHHDDGRPYYAMRFIRGKSLLDAIRRFHADDSLKSDPGARLLALQKLLRRFTDVCNAVAYAHSRGVLHRDLKPDNVMVGKYGETLVVDWGLAKALGTSGEPSGSIIDPDDPLPEASLQPSSTDHLEATQAGSLVGTPAYMSPEQAAGRLDLLGPASDAYGLGATLYHLLAGRPPIQGESLGVVLAKIQSGEVPRPRTLAPWLDPALEAICLKAIALRTEARYASPRGLANDIDLWIADEPVSAWREPWARRARRWVRRHRAPLTAMSAAILVIGIAGGSGWYWTKTIRDASRAMTTREVEKSMIEASLLFDQARSDRVGEMSRWTEALSAIKRGRGFLSGGNGSDELERRMAQVSRTVQEGYDQARRDSEEAKNDREMIDRLEGLRLRSFDIVDGLDHARASRSYIEAFRRYGIDVEALGRAELLRRIRSSKIVGRLASALFELMVVMKPTDQHSIALRETFGLVACEIEPALLKVEELKQDREELLTLSDCRY
jgi:serine/threonine protein kinase